MFRLAKWLPCVAALAGAVMLGTASPARADIDVELSVSDNSGNSISEIYDFTTNSVVSNSTTGSASGTFVPTKVAGQEILQLVGGIVGGYAVTVSTGVSNASGTPSLAFVNSTNNTISGSGSGLTIETSGSGFTTPHAPPPLILSTDSSANTNLGNTATTVTYSGLAGTTLGGSQYASASGSYSTPSGVGTGSGPALLRSFSATSYTLTDILSISSGDAQYGGLSGAVDVTPTPAPAGAVLALTGLPFFGLGAWLRRRKQAV